MIPLARPDLSGNELAYVQDAIQSTWISSAGPYIERFEEEFARAAGTRHALAVCNGTVALHLALLGLDVRPGDEVLVPSLTYIACANAIRYMGAEPVFVEIDPSTWCLDPERLAEKITRRTKGIIAVHLYGHPADMDAVNQVAAVHGLWVVEDAAEAPFAAYKGRPTGSLGRISTFSFYGNKIITSGEGGAVAFDDPSMLTRLRLLRGQGVDPDRRYFFAVTGHNFRTTNVACAMLCAQLERAPAMLARRREIAARYRSGLSEVEGLDPQPQAEWADPSPWLYSTLVGSEFGHTRDELMAHLAEAGIETRPFFIPLHRLPPFRVEASARNTVLPETDRVADAGINLPTYSQMADEDVDRICEVIQKLTR